VAVVVAVGVSVGLIVLRKIRKEPIQPAVSGLLGVVVAALITFYIASAEGDFLPDANVLAHRQRCPARI
jgi:hypothetical protein